MYLGRILLFTAYLACLEITRVCVSDSCLEDLVNCTSILLDTDDNLIIIFKDGADGDTITRQRLFTSETTTSYSFFSPRSWKTR
jgi:hypothetical protein